MSLKVVHINPEAQTKKPDPIKEMAKILRAKWEARDEREAEKMFPGVRNGDDKPKTA